MKRLSAFVLIALLAALTNSGVGVSNASEYDYDAKLATGKLVPVEIEKTKFDEPKIVLDGQSPRVLGVKDNVCQIVIVPGEAKIDREARLAREEAELKRLAAEAAKARARVRVLPLSGPVTGDAWYRLRMCESSNTYNRNSGNGYYGAYQFNISTWRSYAPAGYKDIRPDLAPPAVQDQAALALFNKRGWQPWPACSRKLGLR